VGGYFVFDDVFGAVDETAPRLFDEVQDCRERVVEVTELLHDIGTALHELLVTVVLHTGHATTGSVSSAQGREAKGGKQKRGSYLVERLRELRPSGDHLLEVLDHIRVVRKQVGFGEGRVHVQARQQPTADITQYNQLLGILHRTKKSINGCKC
jgi:hypothetical protein